MNKIGNRTFSARQSYELSLTCIQYARTHCWGCDAEIGEEAYNIPYNDGVYCEECATSLTKGLVISSLTEQQDEEKESDER